MPETTPTKRFFSKRVGRNVFDSPPRVSIIIPAYNSAEYIVETIDSVLAQKFREYEIIVVNDGSPDTDRLERAIKTRLDDITYIKQRNAGAAIARNTGIEHGPGEIIAFLDGDDLWLPEFLSSQVAFLGGSLWTGKACASFARFAERFDLPVACSFRRQMLFSGDHQGEFRMAVDELAAETLAGILRQLLHVLVPHSWHGPACGRGRGRGGVSQWARMGQGRPQNRRSLAGQQQRAHARPGRGSRSNVALTGLPSLGTGACMARRLAVWRCEGLGGGRLRREGGKRKRIPRCSCPRRDRASGDKSHRSATPGRPEEARSAPVRPSRPLPDTFELGSGARGSRARAREWPLPHSCTPLAEASAASAHRNGVGDASRCRRQGGSARDGEATGLQGGDWAEDGGGGDDSVADCVLGRMQVL